MPVNCAIENALLNILKNKSRNILLGVITFVIITAEVAGMSIYNASGAIVKEFKARFGSEVALTPLKKSAEGITADQAIAFSESECLLSTDINSSLTCRSDTLKAIGQTEGRSPNIIQGRENYGGDLSNAAMRLRGGQFDKILAEGKLPAILTDVKFWNRSLLARAARPAFRAGNNDPIPSFKVGQYKNECIVSSEFAKLNQLAVGDHISVQAGLFESGTLVETSISLTIVGIYVSAPSAAYPASYQNPNNEIIADFNTIASIQKEGQTGVAINAAYFLKSPELLALFEEEIRSKGLSPDFSVTTDEAGYRRLVGPIENLNSVSLAFLLMLFALGVAVMALVSMLAIRERKYEIGVLRAMGMKKGQVALGLWVETAAVTTVCFALGMLAGGLLSQPISDTLLAASGSIPVSVSISPLTALEIFAVAIVLASIAGFVSVSQITKYEPMKILMERN
ncbi:MAG: ABC transporter permease [Clostridiales bacterium]|jgi:putative ABC transport system permease protein|nr:ABC transporter permease [Clostridiales bacterium]